MQYNTAPKSVKKDGLMPMGVWWI